jgi:hypothetical protein
MDSSIRRVVGSSSPTYCGHLAVAVDGDALGHEVLLDHLGERLADAVFGMAARDERLGVEVGIAAQLHDALGELIGMLELLVGVLEEFRRGHLRLQAARGEIVLADSAARR